MSRSFPVERPDPRSDRPRAWPVAVIALVGLVAGVLLVRATLDEPHGGAAPDPAPDPAQAGAEVAPASDAGVHAGDGDVLAPEAMVRAEPRPPLAAALEDAGVRQRAVDAGMQASPRPPPGRPPPAGSGRGVTLGRIAYLRCDGAETAGGTYPCPRDRALEEAALAILEALPSCPNAPTEPGEADVRIHFERGSPPEVRLRGTAADRLDGPRLLACVSDPLSRLTTTIDAEKLIVSFRFELR